jgi:hypothetical protein
MGATTPALEVAVGSETRWPFFGPEVLRCQIVWSPRSKTCGGASRVKTHVQGAHGLRDFRKHPANAMGSSRN